MKNYFAKYLPIEGEINHFDYFIFDGKIAQVTCIEKDFIQIMYKGQLAVRANFEGCQKVKLFLCSRDIQVGDRVLTEGDSSTLYEITKIENGDYYFSGPNGHEALCGIEELVKVVGEISPDAGWVKEGDEFDYEDWWYACVGGHYSQGGVRKGGFQHTETNCNGGLSVIMLKGPCGHFH